MFDTIKVDCPLPVKGAPRHFETKSFDEPSLEQYYLDATGTLYGPDGEVAEGVSGEVDMGAPFDSWLPPERWGWLELRAFFAHGRLRGEIEVLENTPPKRLGILERLRGWRGA